jgi:sporulation protein YlmC with PRC-barrel domain
MTGQWRASKLIGLNVYNDQNEKLGDINEVLVDKSGKVTGVVIGVGGFLGIGEKLILVTMDKLKFVDEPMRTTSTAPAAPAGTTGAANPPARTTGLGPAGFDLGPQRREMVPGSCRAERRHQGPAQVHA